MAWTLRGYQQLAVDRGAAYLRGELPGDGGGLIVLPPGAGKSIVIAEIVKRLDGPCIVFQPSAEILQQNANKLLAVGADPKVYSASMRSREVGGITLATIGSVKDRPDVFDAFPYVMVDECHRVSAKGGMYKEFFEALGDIRLLGLTATPFRLSSNGYEGSVLKFLTRTRPRVFTQVVAYAQIGELIDRGYLVKPTYQIVSGFDRSQVPVNSHGADFDDVALKRYYNRIGFADRLRRVILRALEVGRKSILVFTRFVDEAEALVQAVPGCAVVTAKTTTARRKVMLAAFRAGEISVMANVSVLGEGFDYPSLDTVVLARPTMSLTVYYQQLGRVLRPHADKQVPWVIDMVDQVRQFGPIESLWLRPGGVTGSQWAMVTRQPGEPERELTNVTMGPRRSWDRGRRFVTRG